MPPEYYPEWNSLQMIQMWACVTLSKLSALHCNLITDRQRVYFTFNFIKLMCTKGDLNAMVSRYLQQPYKYWYIYTGLGELPCFDRMAILLNSRYNFRHGSNVFSLNLALFEHTLPSVVYHKHCWILRRAVLNSRLSV